MNTCCVDVNPRHTHDAECHYSDGKFYFRIIPSCLPSLFTIRFTAPTDFTAGDAFVIKDNEISVMTSQMEAATTGIFKTGAVMMCEIDLDRKLAFIRTGGASGSGDDVEFQSSDLVYYIDPLGDDSPNNTGAVDSPFKTLGGAGRAAWQNIVMNPLGRLVFSFNPGSYELNAADRLFMLEATHPLGILFKATDMNNKPIIKADHFCSSNGKREFQGLKLHAVTSSNGHVLSPYENAMTILRDSEAMISKSNAYVFHPHCGGTLRFLGSLKIDGNGVTPHSLFACNQASLWATDVAVMLENIPGVSNATAYSDSGHMVLARLTFSGAISGKRYSAFHNGVINTNGGGPNYIPGTLAGTTLTDGCYY